MTSDKISMMYFFYNQGRVMSIGDVYNKGDMDRETSLLVLIMAID